jgi:hypothetical protein
MSYKMNGLWPQNTVTGEFVNPETNPDYLQWLAAGNTTEPADVPTPAEIKVQRASAVQAHLDATAMTYGYDSIASAVTYADEPAVPRFQAEGQAFRRWRSLVWAACYQVQAEVEAGNRAVPTESELLALLPALEVVYP